MINRKIKKKIVDILITISQAFFECLYVVVCLNFPFSPPKKKKIENVKKLNNVSVFFKTIRLRSVERNVRSLPILCTELQQENNTEKNISKLSDIAETFSFSDVFFCPVSARYKYENNVKNISTVFRVYIIIIIFTYCQLYE